MNLLDAALAQILEISVSERLLPESCEQSVVVPNLEVIQASGHDHFTGHVRAFAQQRRNDHPPLGIQLCLLTEVVTG